MTNFKQGLFLSLLVGATMPGNAADFDAARFSGIVSDGMQQWHIPGMAVAVIDDGKVAFREGFGTTSIKDGQGVDEHTLFGLASTTKAFVAAGVLILADDGLLSLDDLATDYIPELHFADPSLTAQVTVRDLLTHRTGLPRTDFWTFRQLMPLDEQVSRLRLVESVAAPRLRLIYQNTMFELAGLIIERVTGMRWDQFLAERLWHPIGMHETYGSREQIPGDKPHMRPHAYIDEVISVPFDLPADLADAAGSAWSSIHDMSLWAQFLLRDGVTDNGKRLISEAGIRDMFEPHQLSTEDDFFPTVELTRPSWRTYGLAWYQQDFQGRKIDFHTGSLDGIVAIIGLDRVGQRAVVALANQDSELRHALLWEVMDNSEIARKRDWNADVYDLYATRRAEGDEEWRETESQRLTGTSPSLSMDQYAGVYRSAVNGDVLVEAHDGVLSMHTGMYHYDLSHWHLDTFSFRYIAWRHPQTVTFSIDKAGDAVSITVFDDSFFRLSASGN